MCLINVLINFAKWLLLKRRHNVYPGLLRQNRMFRLSENTELSMEEIHHQVLQFIDGTRNLYRDRVSVGYSKKRATKNIWKNCAFS